MSFVFGPIVHCWWSPKRFLGTGSRTSLPPSFFRSLAVLLPDLSRTSLFFGSRTPQLLLEHRLSCCSVFQRRKWADCIVLIYARVRALNPFASPLIGLLWFSCHPLAFFLPRTVLPLFFCRTLSRFSILESPGSGHDDNPMSVVPSRDSGCFHGAPVGGISLLALPLIGFRFFEDVGAALG